MSSQPRLVLFDLMDTLLRVESGHDHYWIEIAEALEREKLCGARAFIDRYATLRNGWIDSEIETSMRDRLAQFADVPDALADTLERRFLRSYMAKSSVIDGVREMLDAWQPVCRLGIVSNYFIPGAPRKLLEHHGLLDCFAFVVDSAEVGYRKPGRRIFEEALSLAGTVEPHEVLMIGDNPHADVDGAQSAGIGALHFSPAEPGRADVPVIRSWHEFRPDRSWFPA